MQNAAKMGNHLAAKCCAYNNQHKDLTQLTLVWIWSMTQILTKWSLNSEHGTPIYLLCPLGSETVNQRRASWIVPNIHGPVTPQWLTAVTDHSITTLVNLELVKNQSGSGSGSVLVDPRGRKGNSIPDRSRLAVIADWRIRTDRHCFWPLLSQPG